MNRTGLLYVSAAGALWGTGGLAMQLIDRHSQLGSSVVSAWRMGLAACVVLPAVVATGSGADAWATLRRQPARSVLVGVGVGGYQALYFGAVVAVGVSVATVVSLGVAPVLLTGAAHARGRTRPAPAEAAIVLAALAGLVLVGVAGGAGGGNRPGLGVLLAVASGTTYAASTVIGHALSATGSPLAVTTWTTVFGTVFLIPVAAVAGGPFVVRSVVANAWLVYLGVVTLALAYGLLYAGLRTVHPAAASLASLLEPVTAAIAAAIVLDERIGALGIAGTALIVLAVAGLAVTARSGDHTIRRWRRPAAGGG